MRLECVLILIITTNFGCTGSPQTQRLLSRLQPRETLPPSSSQRLKRGDTLFFKSNAVVRQAIVSVNDPFLGEVTLRDDRRVTVSAPHIRKERAAALLANIARFAIEELASFGLNSLLEGLTDDENDENDKDVIMAKLDEGIESLNSLEELIKDGLDQLKTQITEVMDRQTINKAQDIESELRAHIESYNTVTKSIRAFDPNSTNANEQRQVLEHDIDELTQNLKIIPSLLTKFNLVITGESAVAAGRLAGLACEFVRSVLDDQSKASAEDYDDFETINKILRYRDSLMSMQVASFQIYNSTCGKHSLTCQQNLKNLDDNLGKQEKHFKKCTPFLFQTTNSKSGSGYVKIIHDTSHQVLFTRQIGSIVRDGASEKLDTPKDAGLRCPGMSKDAVEELWSFINVSTSGKGGYLLKQKDYCYLSYDEKFINFKQIGGDLDANEFLICHREKTNAVPFLISADEANENSTYTLRTGDKFLKVHREKASVDGGILVLFLDDEMSNSWKVLSEDSPKIKCDNSSNGEDIKTNLGVSLGLSHALVFLHMVIWVGVWVGGPIVSRALNF